MTKNVKAIPDSLLDLRRIASEAFRQKDGEPYTQKFVAMMRRFAKDHLGVRLSKDEAREIFDAEAVLCGR